jgi:hypothetical protein
VFFFADFCRFKDGALQVNVDLASAIYRTFWIANLALASSVDVVLRRELSSGSTQVRSGDVLRRHPFAQQMDIAVQKTVK